MSVLLEFNVLVALVILVHSVCVINTMGRHTDHLLRIGYVALGVGALAVVIGPLYGYTAPPPAETLLSVGVALVQVISHWRRKGGSYGRTWRRLRRRWGRGAAHRLKKEEGQS